MHNDTPTPSPPLPDAAAIRRLVEEVLRRIGTLPADGRTAPQATAPARGPQAAPPVPAALPAPTTSAAPSAPAATVTATDAVVTAALIGSLPAGTRRLSIAPRGVVTPSARDAAAAAGITIVRSLAAPAGQAAGRPFVVAHAACPGDATGRAAAIARAVPGAQQLPASGLADVVAAIALCASREGAHGILLTGKPAAAVVLANRSPGLRAVTGRDPRALAAAAAECAANLLVLDPAGFAAGALERICTEFARAPAATVPAELAAVPAGCACRGHAH